MTYREVQEGKVGRKAESRREQLTGQRGKIQGGKMSYSRARDNQLTSRTITDFFSFLTSLRIPQYEGC